jgi:hypothetical protein
MKKESFIYKPCSGRAGFEAIPVKPLKHVFRAISEGKISDVVIIVRTPYAAVFKFKEDEIDVFPSGRMLLKTAESESAAKKMVEELMGRIG